MQERLATLREELSSARADEYSVVVIGGKSWAPSDAARFVAKDNDRCAWVPSPVVLGALLPLSEGEVIELYSTNQSVPVEVERELAHRLPRAAELLSPARFENLMNTRAHLAKTDRDFRSDLWQAAASAPAAESLCTILKNVQVALDPLKGGEGWKMAAVSIAAQLLTGLAFRFLLRFRRETFLQRPFARRGFCATATAAALVSESGWPRRAVLPERFLVQLREDIASRKIDHEIQLLRGPVFYRAVWSNTEGFCVLLGRLAKRAGRHQTPGTSGCRSLQNDRGQNAMPKGYIVTCYHSVSDPKAMTEYAKLAGPVLQAAGGNFLVRADATAAYEKGVKQRVVVIEFGSLEKAIAARESEGYKAALKALGNAAVRDVRIVEGVS